MVIRLNMSANVLILTQTGEKQKKWSLSQIFLYNLRCTQKYNSGRTLVKKYYSLNKL